MRAPISWPLVTFLFAGGCASGPTGIRVDIEAPGRTILELSLVATYAGSSSSVPLPQMGGPPSLPETVLVRLPELETPVTLLLSGADDAGDLLEQHLTITSAVHRILDVRMLLYSSRGSDLGATDGGAPVGDGSTGSAGDLAPSCGGDGQGCCTGGVCTAPLQCVAGKCQLCGNGRVDPGEHCDDGNVVDGDGCSAKCQMEGCSSGQRSGLVDYKTFPNVAVCGGSLAYADAVAQAATLCQAGWHMCAPYGEPDITALGPKAAPADSFSAWLRFDDTACNQQAIYPGTACAGSPVGIATFYGAAGCSPAGTCGEGWRPMLATGAWSYSLQSGGFGGACTAHLEYACSTAGGSIAASALSVACCR
jgi:cysteine-rich repeat protein